MTTKFDTMVDSLKKTAQNSDISYRHAAAIIHKETIFNSGFNKYKGQISKNTKIIYTTIHAEMDVLYNTKGYICTKGFDVIVIRINKLLKLRGSRPCNDCIDKLRRAGIRRVYYSNDNGEIEWELVDEMPKIHISKCAKRLMEEDM